MIGELVGNYRVTAELGEGGMGQVYRAHHHLLDRPAAVKVLRPELTANRELVQRFFREAKAATAIRHPGIVDVYDFGHTAAGQAFYVMELLEGGSLAARLRARGRFPAREAATIARGIANALRAAHEQHIIHRDLKPDNVFLVPDPDGLIGERVKVLDFGVAKLLGESWSDARRTQTGALLGTPLYMAPEQARAAGAIDHRADLYSLGCILYELLVGKPPFEAVGAGEILAMQMFNDPERPRARVPELDPALERVVMQLLEKEPDARVATAAEVVAQLAPFCASGASAEIATPTAPVVPILPLAPASTDPARSRSALPLLAGAITLALAGGAVLFALTRGGGDDDHVRDTSAPPLSPAAPAPTPTPPPPTSPTAATTEPVTSDPAAATEDDTTASSTPPDQRPVRPTTPAKTRKPRPGLTTSKGSPIFDTLP